MLPRHARQLRSLPWFIMPAEALPLTVASAADAGGPDHKHWLVTPKGKGLVRQRARGGAQAQSPGVLRITRISDECATV